MGSARHLAAWLTVLATASCGSAERLPEGGSDAPHAHDPSGPEGYGSDADSEAVAPPDGPTTTYASQPQVIYLAFGGETVSACGDDYCSDATSNASSLVKTHFGQDAIAFSAWGTAAQRQAVVDQVSAAFVPYGATVVSSRPSSGPYTMVVITETPGPKGGVSFVDCVNQNPSDVAFVYGLGGKSVSWVVRATAHELGHSYGLAHVSSTSDFMHWQGAGQAFTATARDPERSDVNCLGGDHQDAPAMLTESLAVHPYPCGEVSRVWGPTRFHTAVAISKARFASGAAEVVIASGADEAPDALAAGPLAHHLGAPLLTTSPDALPDVVADEIERLGASSATILGGTGAISAGVENAITALGLSVTRLSGSDRYDTASDAAMIIGPSPSKLAFVASGEPGHLVDALAASGPAASLGVPILLVTQGQIPSATQQALAALGITKTVVVGGQAAVSNQVLAQLPNAERVYGPDRYQTAVAVAERAIDLGAASQELFVARGDLPVDALAAGATGEMLVLSAQRQLSTAVRPFVETHPSQVTLLGGYGALHGSMAKSLCYELYAP